MKVIIIIAMVIVLSSSAMVQEQPSSPVIIADDKLSATDVLSLLKEYDRRYEQRFRDLELIVNEKFTSAEKAIDIANEANEKRFESINEFCGQLKDQANTLMSRTESVSKYDGLASDIATLRLQVISNEARADEAKWLFGIITTAVVIFYFSPSVVS